VLKTYYRLVKPGIVYGNTMTAAAGFLLAAHGSIAWRLFAAALAGTALIIASACVINNYIDRGIDQKMARTKKRALASGTIKAPEALTYAAVLGLAGLALLILKTNYLTVAVGLVGFIDYVVLYGVAKRKTVHGTLVGTIAGATPIVAGYTAVAGRLDSAAIILFLMLALWQMPHFYAIAIYRLKDYSAAGLPVWPVKKGIPSTKQQIILYVLAFTLASTLLTIYGYTGIIYLVVMTAVGLYWLYLGLQGLKTKDDTKWARQMFLFSLIVILVLSVMVSVGELVA
jgi:heme o synthase